MEKECKKCLACGTILPYFDIEGKEVRCPCSHCKKSFECITICDKLDMYDKIANKNDPIQRLH